MSDAREGHGAFVSKPKSELPTSNGPTNTEAPQSPAESAVNYHLGNTKDAIRTDNTKDSEEFQQVPAVQDPEKNSHLKKDEERSKEEAPITSTAQLRDYNIKHGTTSTIEEVNNVKKLEADILAEGSKHVRNPNSESK